MRITSQMLAKTSRESGIPLAQRSLLDVLNKKEDLTDVLNKDKDTKKASNMQKEFHKLGSAADELSGHAARLAEKGENSLFDKAKESGEKQDILSEIKSMIEAYNKTLELLKKADGSLNNYYYTELKNAAEASIEQLKAVGVTRQKDGTLAVEEKELDGADYTALNKAFGDESDFVKKADYISEKVFQNAQANAASISNQYNAKGVSSQEYFGKNKYNFFG